MVRRLRPARHHRLAVPRDPAPARQAALELTPAAHGGRRRRDPRVAGGGGAARRRRVVARRPRLAGGRRRRGQRCDRRVPRHLPLAIAHRRAGVRPRLDVGAADDGGGAGRPRAWRRCSVGRGNYVAELSERCDRHVYAAGLRVRPGFMLTIGNVVNGAGADVRTSPWRRRLVTDHEDVHVWQARWFGPLYPVVYLVWTVAGGAAGAVRVGCAPPARAASPRSSRRVPTTSTRSSGGPTAATARSRRAKKVAAVGWNRACARSANERLTRHDASAAPSSVAGGPAGAVLEQHRPPRPGRLELAEDRADAPHHAVEDHEARRHVELLDHRAVRTLHVEDARRACRASSRG